MGLTFSPPADPRIKLQVAQGTSEPMHSHRHPLLMCPRPRGDTGEALCALVTISSEK